MNIHFEDLWEKCEKFHKQSSSQDDISSILQELELKCNFFSAIENKISSSTEEEIKIKTRAFGEILLTLTNLSLRENIDVYQALQLALQYREIKYFSEKYSK